MLRCWREIRFHLTAVVLTAVFLMLHPRCGAAAPDDVEAKQVQDQVINQFVMNDENFEANVFQPSGNARQARISIENKLKLQINEINRICKLDDTQIQKLKLAASSDVRRFFEEVDVIRKKFKAGKHDQNAWNQVWQEIHPLQTKMAGGLFGESSFFSKSVRKTLSEEQCAKYDAVVAERRRFRYKCSIETSMTHFEDAVPLSHSQHEAIVALMLEETQPPLVFGQYDHHAVMYRFSRVSESKLKSILDDRQWTMAKVQINQNRGMEQFLVQNGIIAKENDDADVTLPKAQIRRKLVRAAIPADAVEPENRDRPQPAP